MNSVNARIEACVYTKFKLDLKIVGSANIVSRQTILWQKTFPTVFLRSKIQIYGGFDMKNQYPQIVEKSLKVIEYLNEKFGWFTIRVYQFPLISGFETFLESMQRNLTRHGLFSWYMWAKFKNKDMVLLVHFGRGILLNTKFKSLNYSNWFNSILTTFYSTLDKFLIWETSVLSMFFCFYLHVYFLDLQLC